MFKNKKMFLICLVFCLSAVLCFADNVPNVTQLDKKSTWGFSITKDFAYYPKAAFIPNGTHFAPTTGWFDGIDLRASLKATQTIAIPFGEHPLVKGNTISFGYRLDITPVAITPKFSFSFTPVAFLVFSSGIEVGTGWNLLGIQGMAKYNSNTNNYDSLVPFKDYHFGFHLGATFQFDLAAVIPGDWNHVVFVADYVNEYFGMNNVPTGEIVKWLASGNKVNGWKYDANFVIGYQMPIMLSMIGLNANLSGYYSANFFDKKYANFNGNFMTVDINPLLQLTFNAHNSMYLLFCFSSRRSFTTRHEKSEEEPMLTFSDREWFFNRIALSYTYTF